MQAGEKWPELEAVLKAAGKLNLPIAGGMTDERGFRITFVPEADLAKVLTAAATNHNEVLVLREALDAFPFVRKTVTSGSGEGLTRLAFKGDYDVPLNAQAISMILDWMEEHSEALTLTHNAHVSDT